MLKLVRCILRFCSSLNLPFSTVVSCSEQNKSCIVLGLFQASLDVSSMYRWLSGFSLNRCRWCTNLAAIWCTLSLSLKMHWNTTCETPRHVSNFTIMIFLLSEDRCLHLIHVFIHFSHWCVSWAFGIFRRGHRLWTWSTTQKSVFVCLSAVQKLLPTFWKFYSIFAEFK